MVSAQQVTLMQDAAAAARTTPCSIQRTTRTADGMGGQTDTWREIASVLGFIGLAQGGQGQAEQIVEERIEQQSRFLIRLPAGTDITIQDRVVADGTTYEVQAVQAPRTIEIQRAVLATVVTS